MKTSSKIAILAAVGAWLITKKKGAISGVGRVGYAPTTTAYLVRYIPKYGQFSVDFPMVWLNYKNGSANLQNSRDHATRFYSYEEAEATAQQLFDEIYHYEHKGFEIVEIHDHDEQEVQDTIEDLLSRDDSFRYRLLSRMQMDCDYYLGNGHRNGQYLWMRMDPQGHIDVMRALWDSFKEKPEWLSMEEINDYAERMGVN